VHEVGLVLLAPHIALFKVQTGGSNQDPYGQVVDAWRQDAERVCGHLILTFALAADMGSSGALSSESAARDWPASDSLTCAVHLVDVVVPACHSDSVRLEQNLGVMGAWL
jgi:hypothetical protein